MLELFATTAELAAAKTEDPRRGMKIKLNSEGIMSYREHRLAIFLCAYKQLRASSMLPFFLSF